MIAYRTNKKMVHSYFYPHLVSSVWAVKTQQFWEDHFTLPLVAEVLNDFYLVSRLLLCSEFILTNDVATLGLTAFDNNKLL